MSNPMQEMEKKKERRALLIEPSTIQGAVFPPPSKSMTARAILFASLSNAPCLIHNYLHCKDTDAMLEAVIKLGAKVMRTHTTLTIKPGDLRCPGHIDPKGSGIVYRFFAALAAFFDAPTTFQRIDRPLDDLLDGLKQLGAVIEKEPLSIRGPLKQGEATIQGADSQPVSALLLLFATLGKKMVLHVKNPGEKPWVDLTLHFFDLLSIPYKREGYKRYEVENSLPFRPFEIVIPADFSSAAFPAVAALATNSSLQINNLDFHGPQGDKRFFSLIEQMGGALSRQKSSLSLAPSPLSSIQADLNDCIDALPALSSLACFCKGVTTIANIEVAKGKESNRPHAMEKELTKMGARVEVFKDHMIVSSKGLKGANMCSHDDHRVAMALIAAALGATSSSTIDDVECIDKTYPSFIKTMQSLGAKLTYL